MKIQEFTKLSKLEQAKAINAKLEKIISRIGELNHRRSTETIR